jgi:REP element-mobilizing transposase RayT
MQGKRALWHDYTGVGFYMITLTTAPRRPLFGCCTAAGIELSPAGKCVLAAWRRIPEFTPQIEASTLCIMPDHLHGILYARERLARSLGSIIRGFKSGVTAELRRLTGDADFRVWEDGYHDLISLNPASIHAYHAYIRDNPRRYRLKQARPDLFTRLEAFDATRLPLLPAGQSWVGFGNPFLLQAPWRMAVRVSRSITTEALEALKESLTAKIRQDAVMVSPFIAPGERALVELALGLPRARVIVLKSGGFPPLYKPGGRYFDLCAAGRLLILSPFAYTGRSEALTRARCLQMNAMAGLIADLGNADNGVAQ